MFHAVEDLPLGWPTIRKWSIVGVGPPEGLCSPRKYRNVHGEIYEQSRREPSRFARRPPLVKFTRAILWTSVNRRNCGWKNIPAGRVYFTVNLCDANMERALSRVAQFIYVLHIDLLRWF